MKTHYRTLGIDRDCAESEIKTAYRRLAAEFHPDRGGDAEIFMKIKEAYLILSDKEKKKSYDRTLENKTTEDANAFASVLVDEFLREVLAEN